MPWLECDDGAWINLDLCRFAVPMASLSEDERTEGAAGLICTPDGKINLTQNDWNRLRCILIDHTLGYALKQGEAG